MGCSPGRVGRYTKGFRASGGAGRRQVGGGRDDGLQVGRGAVGRRRARVADGRVQVADGRVDVGVVRTVVEFAQVGADLVERVDGVLAAAGVGDLADVGGVAL